MAEINGICRINGGYVMMLKSNPICKHIAKAPRANAPTKALSKSLQSHSTAERNNVSNF